MLANVYICIKPHESKQKQGIRQRCYFTVSETGKEKSPHMPLYNLPSFSSVSPTCQPVGTNMLTKLHAGAVECRPVLTHDRLEERTQSSRWSFALFSSAPLWLWGHGGYAEYGFLEQLCPLPKRMERGNSLKRLSGWPWWKATSQNALASQ